jgi:hypothetical protein
MHARKIPPIIGAAILTAALVPPATAQLSPSATLQMGNAYRQQQMLNAIRQTNINQTPHGSLREPPRSTAGTLKPGQNSASKQRMAALMRELTPEYNRRVHEFGTDSANQWLAAKARELGRHDAQAARSR